MFTWNEYRIWRCQVVSDWWWFSEESWIPPLSYQTIPHFFLQVTLHAHIFLLARNVYYTHDEADRTTYPANKIIILYSSRSQNVLLTYSIYTYHVTQSIIQIILSHNVSNTCLNDYEKKLRDEHLPSFPSQLHPESFHSWRLLHNSTKSV